jgi:hypothetical protein
VKGVLASVALALAVYRLVLIASASGRSARTASRSG